MHWLTSDDRRRVKICLQSIVAGLVSPSLAQALARALRRRTVVIVIARLPGTQHVANQQLSTACMHLFHHVTTAALRSAVAAARCHQASRSLLTSLAPCRYYVRTCQKPKARAALQLVLKVGSIVEEEHERGIAHIVEHLAFNASEVRYSQPNW